MSVHELELDLEAFEGPFDLLLTLVLKEEVPLADVDVAGIVLAFVEELAEREQLDLEACGEFLVLVSSLLELKARALVAGEDVDLEELDPEEAAEELARRLAEYRRFKEASQWLAERLAAERDRYFRLGPAPLAPKLEPTMAAQEPELARDGAARARGRASGGLGRAHGAPLPAGLGLPRALPGAARPAPPVRLRAGGRGADDRRAGGCVPRPARAAEARGSGARAGCAVRTDSSVQDGGGDPGRA